LVKADSIDKLEKLKEIFKEWEINNNMQVMNRQSKISNVS